jgi:hypothetical protein
MAWRICIAHRDSQLRPLPDSAVQITHPIMGLLCSDQLDVVKLESVQE